MGTERGTNGVVDAWRFPQIFHSFCGKRSTVDKVILPIVWNWGGRFPPPRKKEIRSISKNSFFRFNIKYWNIKIRFSQIRNSIKVLSILRVYNPKLYPCLPQPGFETFYIRIHYVETFSRVLSFPLLASTTRMPYFHWISSHHSEFLNHGS